MIEVNLIDPKAEPVSKFCPGLYILPLWKQAKTHFMMLTLKKRIGNQKDRYKLCAVIREEYN